MKRLLYCLLVVGPTAFLSAQSTISPVNRYAYGANIGWIDWRGDGTNGARIGEFVCAGFLYSANAGWIHLGSGAPANGVRYQNNSATDFGVNHDGLGNLEGLAWSANMGWLTFNNRDANGTTFDAPTVDLRTGRLRGLIYSANAGWISLSNALAFVQTDTVAPATDSDGDGIADAWELGYTGTLTFFTATSNADGDRASDLEEYLADTNPLVPGDEFQITAFNFSAGGTNNTVTWTTRPTRSYSIQKRPDLNPGSSWTDSGLGLIAPDGATTTRTFSDAAADLRFLRIEAVKSLSP